MAHRLGTAFDHVGIALDGVVDCVEHGLVEDLEVLEVGKQLHSFLILDLLHVFEDKLRLGHLQTHLVDKC